jgi:hypothetical protein
MECWAAFLSCSCGIILATEIEGRRAVERPKFFISRRGVVAGYEEVEARERSGRGVAVMVDADVGVDMGR